MKFNVRQFALTAGIIWGVAMLLTTLAGVYWGYATDFLNVMVSVYPGFSVTVVGSIVGLIYGFIDAFVGTYIFVWVYEKVGKQ
jgi:hypothetical protein